MPVLDMREDGALFGAYWRNLVDMAREDGMGSVSAMVSVLERDELETLVCHLVNSKLHGRGC
jgi:hypothetical protein